VIVNSFINTIDRNCNKCSNASREEIAGRKMAKIKKFEWLKDWFYKQIRIDPGGCWEWLRAKNDVGYGKLSIGGISFSAHRVSYVMHSGEEIPDGMLVLHSCDNRACVNPAHLRLGTSRDNRADMLAKGRWKPGRRKLTEEQVEMIRERRFTARELAKTFEVSLRTIYCVWTGQTWKQKEGDHNERPD
jgi:hypothetical protein